VDRSRGTLLLVATVGILLVVLAALQYRWIGELSRAEEQRLRSRLDRSLQRFAADLDRELADLVWALMLPPELEEQSSGRMGLEVERWRARARHPGLLRDLWRISREAGASRLERLDEKQRAWEEVEPWPAELAAVRSRLAPGSARFELPVIAEVPALVIPRLADRGPGQWGGRRFGAPLLEFMIARLDLEVITSELLPELAERHFESGDYDLAVIDASGAALYRTESGRPLAELLESDARAPLLRVRRLADRGPGRPRFDRSPRRSADQGAWTLVARHTAGSLAEAVHRARRRNLIASTGVLVLLGVAAGLLVGAARRAERLARQQLEFVAGVTHELHTPLAAICSAGSNLADGVVAEPDRVRSYGDMIRNEGRRLTRTVDQVLEFAGIQSGERAYRMEPLDVSALVEAVLAQNALVLQESGLELERELAASLPPVEGDPAALRRALDNLVANAARHARSGRWLGVSTRLGDGGREVEIRVSDRGPGVAREERGRLFEPFFRGRASGAVGGGRGTGLGLSIVRHVAEAHAGSVSVESPSQGGSCFVLRLPVASRARETA
jgi:signal transduction histidine kinase